MNFKIKIGLLSHIAEEEQPREINGPLHTPVIIIISTYANVATNLCW
jgi:hypothetical protein